MSRVPRVYCSSLLEPGKERELPDKPSRHILKVLRLRSGDPLLLFDGSGREYGAELRGNIRGRACVHIESEGPLEPQPALSIQLVLGVSRGQRMDYALQKATELGVSGILPLFTMRSVVRLDDRKREQRLEHWRQVVIAACEQSGRCRLPEVKAPQHIGNWMSDRSGGGILLDPDAQDTLASIAAPARSIEFLVGPEGGLTPDEKAAALSSGYTAVRLGPRILRTETAPLAAIAAAQMLWGDFR